MKWFARERGQRPQPGASGRGLSYAASPLLTSKTPP